MSSEYTSTAQAELSVRYRTFLLKIVSRLHFLKSFKCSSVAIRCIK